MADFALPKFPIGFHFHIYQYVNIFICDQWNGIHSCNFRIIAHFCTAIQKYRYFLQKYCYRGIAGKASGYHLLIFCKFLQQQYIRHAMLIKAKQTKNRKKWNITERLYIYILVPIPWKNRVPLENTACPPLTFRMIDQVTGEIIHN